ncbi:MAG: ribosome-associated translation inhibitor RaiA, partial [Nitrospirota bacterium]|nr:ribosome-associated translation inhibitor RaiA [Nitrospirota bacterium]
MQILITGRHVEVTPALRRYIEVRMKRVERFEAKLGDVQVILGVEKYRHTAEVILTLNGVAVQAKASTKEMYASIDEVL